MAWSRGSAADQRSDANPGTGELSALRAALDQVPFGVVLLDRELRAQFINRAFRKMWRVPDSKADSKPAFVALMYHGRDTCAYAVPADQLDAHIAHRIALVRAGDPTPEDLRVGDGRIIRSQCAVLPGGGRMLTYTDVTDLVRNAEVLERLATTDAMTDIYNRRHFVRLAEAEWSRFQRYHRPLSLMLFDIDRFNAINDRFGHDVGDRALSHVADLCKEGRRSSDIVARIGGEEFALLLPETDPAQAELVAARLHRALADRPFATAGASVAITVSIGISEATLSMSGVGALMKAAGQALYLAKASGRNRTVSAVVRPAIDYDLAAE